jgi:hypothetical protein
MPTPLNEIVMLIDAVARLIGVLAWPVVFVFALTILRPALHDFLSTLGEVRLKGAGFEASARRRLNFDAVGQKLHDFWKPAGKIDRSNAARISACMKELGIAGSVASLINAGTEQDRARVASSLSLKS